MSIFLNLMALAPFNPVVHKDDFKHERFENDASVLCSNVLTAIASSLSSLCLADATGKAAYGQSEIYPVSA